MLGIRTASHAFDARGDTSAMLADWPEFDAEVLGGNYQGHYGRSEAGTKISIVPGMEQHSLLKGFDPEGFESPCTLYENRPLRSDRAQVLLVGSIPGKPPEPVLWLNDNAWGKALCTSLGHWKDSENEGYYKLMVNAVEYLLEQVAK
jgi:hypothetical protein